jgi:hypothetical protein
MAKRQLLSYAVLASVALLAACSTVDDDAEPAQDDLSVGIADYTFFTCRSATELPGGEKLHYAINHFNNTSTAIDLDADVPASVREAARGRDPGDGSKSLYTGVTAKARLVKGNTDKWTDDAYYTVVLTNKGAGKSIEVVDHRLRKTISASNGFCTVSCEGPTVLTGGRCIWTGEAPLDAIGNYVIETLPSLAAGPLVRASGSLLASRGPGIVVAIPQNPHGPPSPKILGTSFIEAWAKLDKIVRGKNPLAGTPAVGAGNCANEAIAQALYLTTGARVCAIPYSLASSDIGSSIVADAKSVMPGSIEPRLRAKTLEDLTSYLNSNLEEGQLVLLGSSVIDAAGKAVKGKGHISLVAKVAGELVHIDNQLRYGSGPFVKLLSDHGTTWNALADRVAGEQPAFAIMLMFGKLR